MTILKIVLSYLMHARHQRKNYLHVFVHVFVLFTLRVKPIPHAEREEYIAKYCGITRGKRRAYGKQASGQAVNVLAE
jgi:hypothetical protein